MTSAVVVDFDVQVHKTDAEDDEEASSTKRALVGAGARILFYPTLLYNVIRHNVQPHHFRWWDHIDQVTVDLSFVASKSLRIGIHNTAIICAVYSSGSRSFS